MISTGQTAKSLFDESISADDLSKILKKTERVSLDALIEAAATDATDSFPARAFTEIADIGLLEAVIPPKYGGAGLGTKAGTTLELLTALKYLGYGNLVVGRIFEGHFNAWQLIAEFGNAGQIKKLADESRREKHLFGVWNTEAGDGVKITAHGSDNFYLNGAKTFASGTDFVKRPIVTGKLANGGWQMFIVPMEKVQTAVDDSWWKPLGMQSSRSYRIDFSGVRTASEDFIGKPDDYYRQPFFSGGAIRFAAVQLGAAELLFDLTRAFLRELNRTDNAFQQMRLGEMAIAVESGNNWLKGAAKVFDDYLTEKDESQIESLIHYAGMMRTAIEQICQNVIVGCERSVGSRGLLKPYHFERVIRDLKTYLRQAAPDATLTGIGKFVLNSDQRSNNRLWQDNGR